MAIFSKALTERLYTDLRRAQNEAAKKERFCQYLTQIFSGDIHAQSLISAIALGAERTIVNIPRGSLARSGRADSQTDTIIIEWERDLTKTGDHAIEQLKEYLSGNWRSGEDYRYVLIATDGLHWRVLAPDWSYLQQNLFSVGSDFSMREIGRFDLHPDNFDEFPFFLDQTIFVISPKIATLANIEADFGDTSNVFINSIRTLQTCVGDIHKKSELSVAFQQWQRFLSIAYGKFNDSPEMFFVHTYLSAFAKIMAFRVLDSRAISGGQDLKEILNGEAFHRLNVERFVENDFFSWVNHEPYFSQLRPMFRSIMRGIGEYDLVDIKEDILKGVYQELIDLETRHALGEYFTPDWLCERMLAELKIFPETRILDPACGSGSFLRGAIAAMRQRFPELSADKLSAQIVGIDIHPLSVQIAKTTLLVSLGDQIRKSKVPVVLNVFLANSLLVPRGTADLFQTQFTVAIDNQQYVIDVQGFKGAEDFDTLIELCSELIDRYPETVPPDRFTRLIGSSLPAKHATSLPSELYDIYVGMKKAKDAGRDSIWKFILQNSYKPVFLRMYFDYVVGNPPWLTYADIANAGYQGVVKKLADEYSVTPMRVANMPHLELAAVFLAHSINYFLKAGGTLAFVLPRSVISADQHENTRSGSVRGVQLREIWDLCDVFPLFRVPCMVAFGTHSPKKRLGAAIPASGIPGKQLAGRLPLRQAHWQQVSDRIEFRNVRFFYSQLIGARGRMRSALTTRPFRLSGRNTYADSFKQGATILPRTIYFVRPEGDVSLNEVADRVIPVRTDQHALAEAKAPWNHAFHGRVEGRFLFLTAISRNILPFLMMKPLLIVLPVTREVELSKSDKTKKGGSRSYYEVHASDALLGQGARYTSAWFNQAEEFWLRNRTEKSASNDMDLTGRLDFQAGITAQNPEARYLILYTSSSSDASAVVVDRDAYGLDFIVDHKAYWYEASSLHEAHYVCAFLNSGFANDVIKEFQSRGLFGPRDVHKTILSIPLPAYNRSNRLHMEIADLGRHCAEVAQKWIGPQVDSEFDARALGRARSALRDFLAKDLDKIDSAVEEIVTAGARLSDGAFVAGKVKRRTKRNTTLRLFD